MSGELMFARTDRGAVVALVHKAGLQSMRHALRCNGDELSAEEACAAPVRVQFIREPTARLVSAYRFFKTIYARGSTPQPGEPQPDDVASWDTFMAYVAANDNVHWRQQSVVVDAFKPTNVHRFEDVSAHWPRYHKRPFPHLNASDDYPVGVVPDEIQARYEKDRVLWLGL